MYEDLRPFYDDLAEDYHFIFENWEASVAKQAAVLDRIIRDRLGPGSHRILDCTCGIGTQALGLARLGYQVLGTDLSPAAVTRAAATAQQAAIAARFAVCDVRNLSFAVMGDFDVVLSCDNSLPHLLSRDDLSAGVASMLSKLRPGGLFLASLRDYDTVLQEKPTTTVPVVHQGQQGRRVMFQLWQWHGDGRTYTFDLVLGFEENGAWKFRSRRALYRAITRAEMSAVLQQNNAERIEWLMPAETSFFQPVVAAIKGG